MLRTPVHLETLHVGFFFPPDLRKCEMKDHSIKYVMNSPLHTVGILKLWFRIGNRKAVYKKGQLSTKPSIFMKSPIKISNQNLYQNVICWPNPVQSLVKSVNSQNFLGIVISARIAEAVIGRCYSCSSCSFLMTLFFPILWVFFLSVTSNLRILWQLKMEKMC